MAGAEGTVIIFDVGRNSAVFTDNDAKVTFFDKSKACIMKIFERKILVNPKDEIALILLGTDRTTNNLHRTLGGYDHITIAFDMAITNWNMLRVIDKDVKPEGAKGDWMDALIVAMDFIRSASRTRKYSSLRILLFTTFATAVNEENADVVSNGLRGMHIELVVINNNILCTENDDEDDWPVKEFSQTRQLTMEQKRSEYLIQKVIDNTDGALSNFDQAMFELMYFPKKKVKGMPWNCQLSIGSQIKINTTSYIYVTDAPIKFKTESSLENTTAKTSTDYFKGEQRIIFDADTLIKGYMYGASVIPVDEDLRISDENKKCLTCIGFTSETSIMEEYLVGKGSNIVVPQIGFENSEKMFVSLVDAMLKSKTVMIVRKVYRDKTAPKLCVLFPQFVKSYPCMTMVELCFAENMLHFKFPNLKSKKNQPTPKQYDVVDKLIDAMDLMAAFEDESGPHEALAFKKTSDPSFQYIYRCITHRAVHPNEELAKPDEELLDLLDIPKKLKSEAQPILEQMKAEFPLELLEVPKYNFKFQLDIPTIDDGTSSHGDGKGDERKIFEVGTVNPMEDFAYLLDKGEKISKICDQLHTVICDLLFKSMTPQDDKIKKALVINRETAKDKGAHYYNVWIQEFKNLIIQKGKLQFWADVITKEKLGLICREESDSTAVTQEESDKFYEIESKEPQNNDDGDIDQLFDEM